MCAYRLVNKDREVLRHGMPKVGAEYSNIETASIPDAHHRLWLQLISDSETWPESPQIVFNIAVKPVRPEASYAKNALAEVSKASISLSIHGFREIILPAHAVGQCQLTGYAELILGV